ncbi:MAG TPA: hypothetical protein VGH28_17405 [Polyangiaceae bacterium]|jgi:hypothetical protein
MAEEKKPKIDLKARLGKGAAAPTPTPPPVGSAPVSAPVSASSAPPVGASGPGLPVPPGVPIGRPAIDPNNPLAAVVAPRPMSIPVSAPAQAQRIEVDDMAVQQAASRARKTGLVVALIALVVGVGLGTVVGSARKESADRDASKKDAADLSKNVTAAKSKLQDLAAKVEDGAKTLQGGKEFPKDLANQLGGINIDFDGSQLALRHFSAFPTETSGALSTFITEVSMLNEQKTAVKNLLTKLEKPISAQIAAAASGQHSIQYVVLLGGPNGKDQAGNYVASLGLLNPPVSFSGETPNIPNDLKASVIGHNIGVGKYKGGKLDEPSAMYVDPRSYDAVCPSETRGLVAQLAIKLGDVLQAINGDPKPEGDIVVDTKPGLLKEADDLVKGLDKIANGK